MRGARGNRRKNFGWIPDLDARRKFLFDRQHTDDGEGAIGKTESRSSQIGAASEIAFPKAVADHCDFLGFRERFGREEAA